ncbi:MAG: hypothetical protein IT442_08380, partial [Phycisphaeraceae bacterium]|nr:hypothetical protein [Phycisphaeraceae bacterium]
MTDSSEIFATLTPTHPRPGGLLLVGTASTLRQLRLTLHLASQSAHVIGCLTGPGKGQSSASGKLRMLGSWDAASVDRALSLGPIAQALICLP